MVSGSSSECAHTSICVSLDAWDALAIGAGVAASVLLLAPEHSPARGDLGAEASALALVLTTWCLCAAWALVATRRAVRGCLRHACLFAACSSGVCLCGLTLGLASLRAVVSLVGASVACAEMFIAWMRLSASCVSVAWFALMPVAIWVSTPALSWRAMAWVFAPSVFFACVFVLQVTVVSRGAAIVYSVAQSVVLAEYIGGAAGTALIAYLNCTHDGGARAASRRSSVIAPLQLALKRLTALRVIVKIYAVGTGSDFAWRAPSALASTPLGVLLDAIFALSGLVDCFRAPGTSWAGRCVAACVDVFMSAAYAAHLLSIALRLRPAVYTAMKRAGVRRAQREILQTCMFLLACRAMCTSLSLVGIVPR